MISLSPRETSLAGLAFGHRVMKPGLVIVVRGELGAGKTHFIKGIAASVEIDDRWITSPTYALANEYECMLNGEPFTLYHLDCYRFEKPEELLELGVEDYLYPANAVTIIEWPERIEELIPPTALDVEILIIGENDREIILPGKGRKL